MRTVMSTDPGSEPVDVIDDEGRVIGTVTRREMRARRLPHRSTYILVFNGRGELFVHLRTPAKDVYMTGASMGGQVTAVAIEHFPRAFVGAMPVCGVLGDAELFDYFLDFHLGFSLQNRTASHAYQGTLYPPKENGFGYQSLDFRLEKTFEVGRYGLGVIGEIFNATNAHNYGCIDKFVGPPPPGNPDPYSGNPNLGNPTCVVSLGRREQVGLRVSAIRPVFSAGQVMREERALEEFHRSIS